MVVFEEATAAVGPQGTKETRALHRAPGGGGTRQSRTTCAAPSPTACGPRPVREHARALERPCLFGPLLHGEAFHPGREERHRQSIRNLGSEANRMDGSIGAFGPDDPHGLAFGPCSEGGQRAVGRKEQDQVCGKRGGRFHFHPGPIIVAIAGRRGFPNGGMERASWAGLPKMGL